MDEDLKQIRKFVAERLSKFGLKLRETYDDHAKGTSNAWSLTIFASTSSHTVLFVSDTGFQGDARGESVSASTQDELWKTFLFAFLVKNRKTTYVRYAEISTAEDGITECNIKTELVFGVDVSDCTSWKEVMLKCAISEG